MGKMSRDKGARFEREVCKLLAEWWGAEFQRTPLSGGSRLADGWGMAGDVVCAEEFPFHVECKHVEGWELSHLLTHKDMGLFGKWLEQACSECDDEQIPLVIFKRNRHPIMVMMVLPGLSDLERDINNQVSSEMLEVCYYNDAHKSWQTLKIMKLETLTKMPPAMFEKPWD